MTTTTYVTIGFLFAAVLFGGITVHGLKTGQMLALGDFAKREKDPDWFRGWAIINGGTAAMAAIGFLLMVAVSIFGQP